MNKKYCIGKRYGGGIIFWMDPSGEHGLIAATKDQGIKIHWYNDKYIKIGATADGVYAGKTNTNLIISKQGEGNYAAQICANYRKGEYDDWYLPSKSELDLLYQQRFVVNGIADDYYWSSTEHDNNGAWSQYLYSGSQIYLDKFVRHRVRAIRAF